MADRSDNRSCRNSLYGDVLGALRGLGPRSYDKVVAILNETWTNYNPPNYYNLEFDDGCGGAALLLIIAAIEDAGMCQ
jgi:hypothetical protein